ncbi:MAG: ABC transporter permease subunit [Halobaculum sp.]
MPRAEDVAHDEWGGRMVNSRFVLRRVAVAGGTTLAVVTAAFALVAFTPDPPESLFATGGPPLPGSPRDSSTPLVVRYVTWLADLVTLQWGTFGGRPTTAVVADRVLRTGLYVVPGALVAYLGGVVSGFHSAQTTPLRDRLERGVVYLAFGLPTAVLAILLINHGLQGPGLLENPFYDGERAALSAYNLARSVGPAALVALGLLAVQARHARSEWQTYDTTTLVRLVRAKGGGPITVARHVLRNAAAPLVSVLVSETLGLLLLIVMVTERIFRIDGFGSLLFTAASERSPALVISVTVVTVVLGVGGTLLHDLLQATLDPRVGEES